MTHPCRSRDRMYSRRAPQHGRLRRGDNSTRGTPASVMTLRVCSVSEKLQRTLTVGQSTNASSCIVVGSASIAARRANLIPVESIAMHPCSTCCRTEIAQAGVDKNGPLLNISLEKEGPII